MRSSRRAPASPSTTNPANQPAANATRPDLRHRRRQCGRDVRAAVLRAVRRQGDEFDARPRLDRRADPRLRHRRHVVPGRPCRSGGVSSGSCRASDWPTRSSTSSWSSRCIVFLDRVRSTGALLAGAGRRRRDPDHRHVSSWAQAAGTVAAYLPAMAIVGALIPVHRLLQQRPVVAAVGDAMIRPRARLRPALDEAPGTHDGPADRHRPPPARSWSSW